MTSLDICDWNYDRLQAYLAGQRREVLEAWLTLGPGTTRQIATRARIELLTFRPRTTELVQLCLVKLVGKEGTEGVYEACSEAETREMLAAARQSGYQPEFNLKT